MSITYPKEVKTFMISNEHRQKLASWFFKNNYKQFFSKLKLQKFLFFYEAFRKLDYGEGDFTSLKAYKNGPVYSDIYGDYTYRLDNFVTVINEMNDYEEINKEIAKLSSFIVSALNEEELSNITHELNIWKVHEKSIKQNIQHIKMNEDDFTNDDFMLLNSLKSMFSFLNLDDIDVITVNKTNYVLKKGLKEKLSKEQQNVLLSLAENNLNNPVYVTLDEDGVLEID